MNRTKERTKRKKVLVTLPDNYLTALDNKIDNILIRTRGDAVISLLTELQKARPGSLEFEEMIYIKLSELTQYKRELIELRNTQPKPEAHIPQWITSRKWLNENTMKMLVGLLEIADDANETSAMIAIDSIKTAVKGWGAVGNDGLRDLRRIRAEKKKVEAEGAP